MYEFYNDEWSVQPNDSWVSQDGTFSNTAVFTGKYKILAEGPFETVEPIEMEVSGSKQMNFEVTPFCAYRQKRHPTKQAKLRLKLP